MTALEGIRVIDLGQFYFGPYCTMLLARLGAEVIKVEPPEGDPFRRLPTADADGTSVQFQFMNAGKRMMSLDLKSADGQQKLRALVRTADILVQNLRPGSMEKFGLGYDELSEVNPRLIMASASGYGSFGPYAGQAAMDLSIQARTAYMSTTGFEDGPPIRTGPSVVDILGGAHLVGAVMAALFQRERTGRGQHVEVALQDASLTSLTSNIAGYINSGGTIPERTGNRNGGLSVTPYNSYRTQDGWIALLCPTQAHWERLKVLMDDPAADDPSYASMAGRGAAMDAIDAIVERWTLRHQKALLGELLRHEGIPAAPVVTLPELLEDPHVKARGVLRQMHDDRGDWFAWGSPFFLSDSPMVPPVRPGRLNADTEYILQEIGIHDSAQAVPAGD